MCLRWRGNDLWRGHDLAECNSRPHEARRPAAAQCLVDPNQIKREIGPRLRQLILIVREEVSRYEHARIVGSAFTILDYGQVQGASSRCFGERNLLEFRLRLKETDDSVFDLGVRLEDSLFVLCDQLLRARPAPQCYCESGRNSKCSNGSKAQRRRALTQE